MRRVPGIVRRVPRWIIVVSWLVCCGATGVVYFYVPELRYMLFGFFAGAFWTKLFLFIDHEAEINARYYPPGNF